jgi:hypothetical protein
MKKEIANTNNTIFEQIKSIDENGNEYWGARQLAKILEYTDFRNFNTVINKAKEACKNNGEVLENHLVDFNEMVPIGSGAKREIESVRLSRLACLFIMQNADQSKTMVSSGLSFFNQEDKNTQLVHFQQEGNLLFYTTPQGNTRIDLSYDGETFWVTQKQMAALFDIEVSTINYHLQQIFDTEELNKYAVIRKIRITALDGKSYLTQVYNLDVVIAVGYRVNSFKATQFRVWATNVLKEFIIKGFVIDDERLKQGGVFGKDHFEELLERIREIRTSERRLYQKITDIYATASDYNVKAPTTKGFYAKVQNKLHWAITGQTAAEIIHKNADAKKPFMGLKTWKQAPEGKVLKTDVTTAKNYLEEKPIKELNQIVSAYLDLAENRAQRQIPTTMEQWAGFLDNFLELSSYPILDDKGKISAERAKIKALNEFEKYRVKQDQDYISDFDKEVKKIAIPKKKKE